MVNASGGSQRGGVYRGLLNIAADVDLEKTADWAGTMIHAGLLLPHGRSLTEEHVGDAFVVSNIDADDELHLFEFWLERRFAEDKFSVRIGQIALDQEFVFTEQGALFNNAAFGWFPIVGTPAPVYPQGAPGLRLRLNPGEKSYVQIAIVDGDIDPAGDNAHGTKLKLDEGALIFGEVGYSWEIDGKAGIIKFGGWYHTDKFDHVRIDDAGLSLADPGSSGIPKSLDGNWGLYAVAEQMLWKENPGKKDCAQGVGLFGRVGSAPSDRNFLGLYAEAGVVWAGLLPGRDQDRCGVGIAYGRVSSDSRGRVADDNFLNASGNVEPDREIVIEAEYQFNLRPRIVIQPGVQHIIHPGGSSDIADATIIGLRTIISF